MLVNMMYQDHLYYLYHLCHLLIECTKITKVNLFKHNDNSIHTVLWSRVNGLVTAGVVGIVEVIVDDGDGVHTQGTANEFR